MRIGFIVDILNEEYQISFIRGMRKLSKDADLQIVCFQYESLVNKKLSQNFSKKDFFGLDGIIILTSVVQDKINLNNLDQLKAVWGNIPFVSVGQVIQDVPSIISESENSMKELLVHLIEYHNYKNVLFLGGRDSHQDNILREQNFIDMMKLYKTEGKINDFEIIRGDYTEESAIQALFDFENLNVKKIFDVIVCANDNMAIGVNKFLKMYQSRCFSDNCAVTGFDDIPQAQLENPALTTVMQPMEEMGGRALLMMKNILEGKKVNKVEHVESKFIIRASCGCMESNEVDIEDLKNKNKKIQFQYLYSEKLLRMISYMGQELNSVYSIQEMRGYIDRNLDLIGVKNFCILSFIESEKSFSKYIYPLYVRKNGKMDDSFYSVPKVLLREFSDYFFELNDAYISKFLLLGKNTLGGIFYQADDELHPYICSISINIAQTIHRLKIREEDFKYAENLEKEVQKRTKELLESNNRRIEVEAQVLKISEAERQRFSTDLHDDICQRLAGISMLCRSYSNKTEPVEKSEMVELASLISDTLQRTRQYAHNSYPVELENLGINHSLNKNKIELYDRQLKQ